MQGLSFTQLAEIFTLHVDMSIGFIFSGQGAQAVGMGKSLYENSAAAKQCFEQANEVLGFDLKTICFAGPEQDLTETRICQPALYVHGIAVVEALKEAGRLPDVQAAFGLSLGELTALAFAGVYNFATGLKIVAERGRLMQTACDATDGAMASLIGGSVAAAQELSDACDVDIGNLNCPGQTVLSGEREKINVAVSKAKEKGFKMAVPLKVAGAYHSRLMQSASDAFAEFLADIPFAQPRMPVFANTTGQAIQAPEAIKQSLVKQVVATVRWEDCMRSGIDRGIDTLYECGPGTILAGLAKRIDRSVTVTSLGEYGDLSI